MSFPQEHWRQLHSTKPHERLMREISRRADVVAIFPDRPSVIHLACALLAEQDDAWATGRRCFSVESMDTLAGTPGPRRTTTGGAAWADRRARSFGHAAVTLVACRRRTQIQSSRGNFAVAGIRAGSRFGDRGRMCLPQTHLRQLLGMQKARGARPERVRRHSDTSGRVTMRCPRCDYEPGETRWRGCGLMRPR